MFDMDQFHAAVSCEYEFESCNIVDMETDTTVEAHKPKMEKEKNLAINEEGREISSKNAANELNYMSSNNKEVIAVNAKDVKYLVDELGVESIKAANLLRRFGLNQAIKHLLDN